MDGVATFSNLSVNLVGSGYKLNATSGALPAALSNSFDATSGPPATLAFLVQPSNVVAGSVIAPAMSVTILDAGGNVVTNVIADITLSFYAPYDLDAARWDQIVADLKAA